MPGVMQPGIADPGRLKQCFPFAPVGTDIFESLKRAGISRLVLINGHGGKAPGIQ